MRRLKHIIYTVFILALIVFIIFRALPAFESWFVESMKDSSNPSGTKVQLTYQLSQKKWTTFPIEKGSKHLKLISNVEYYKTHNNAIKYAIEAEIINSSGKVLMKKLFYFKNDAKTYIVKHSSRILSNPFLLKGGRYITPSLPFLLPLNNLKQPASIKLKQHVIKSINNVVSVLIRISVQDSVPKSKKNILWYRLSPSTRKGLASGNFYPEYMLIGSEKQNILSHLWEPIGPQGNKGHDYDTRRIGIMPRNALKHLNLLDGDELKTEKNAHIKTEMYKIYLESGFNGFFKSQTKKNINAAKELFIKLFNGSTASELKEDWKKLGMNVAEFKRDKKVYTLIYEEKNKLLGRGFYMFCRSDVARNIVLEMPHRFWDTHTGNIGYKLMLTGYYLAAGWNTVQRYQTPNDLSSSSDMAHAANSFFYSFTKAFAESMPENSILVQPHGFSNKKQQSYYGEKASVVLSNSTPKPSKQFLFYAEIIKKVLPQPVYTYPLTDVKWLAALNNVSARVLRKANCKQIFIHMEMNDKTREEMTKGIELRKKFTKGIIENMSLLQNAMGSPLNNFLNCSKN